MLKEFTPILEWPLSKREKQILSTPWAYAMYKWQDNKTIIMLNLNFRFFKWEIELSETLEEFTKPKT